VASPLHIVRSTVVEYATDRPQDDAGNGGKMAETTRTTVRRSEIDTSADGRISNEEWQEWRRSKGISNETRVQVIADGDDQLLYDAGTAGDAKFTDGFLSQNGAALDLYDAEANKIRSGLEALLTQIAEEKKNGTKEKLEELKQQLLVKTQQATTLNEKAGKNLVDVSTANNELGGENSGFKAALTNGQPGSQTTAGQSAQLTGANGQPVASSFPPAGWSAETTGAKFDTNAYANSMMVQDNVMSSYDAANQNVNRSKQLMMLFYYFARMAQSGDMGQMYQFMKFITYIISKDKANQQVQMGYKLIQMQNQSREWTNKLLKISTDPNDPNASTNLMKEMTIIKSKTDEIATSQKLISQMMEEFAQVVETLTNVTKAALETAGRISRTVSTIRS